ncbi:unnamed protein product [Auanema sp. JU1783]|nr:unnamed protein product [Auanema sp. JU1783]
MSRLHVFSFILLVLLALAQASSLYRFKNNQDNAIPRSSLLISGRGFMPGFVDQPSSIFLKKRGQVGFFNAQEDKRSGRSVVPRSGVPRSGLLISGRGWLPGFYEQDWTNQIYL